MTTPSVSPPPSPYALRRIFRVCPDCGLPQRYIPGSRWTHLSPEALEICIGAYHEPRTDEEIRQLFNGTYQGSPRAKQKGAPPMHTKALVAMTEEQMLARIATSRFPQDLTIPQKNMLARVAIDYGLDPLLGELILYEGAPYVTIDGRRRKAQETGLLDGISIPRPATKDEREAWQIPQGDYLFFVEVYVKGASHPFVAQGRVRAAETKKTDKEAYREAQGGKIRPIVLDPQGMAAKRAEARALRMAFSLPLPSAESAGTLDDERPYIDTEARELPEEEPQSHAHGEMREVRCELHDKPLRNGKYGPYCPTRVMGPDGKERWCKGQAARPECLEGRELPDEAGPAVVTPESPTRATTTALTDVTVDSLAELFNACRDHFGIKTWPEICQHLNVPNKTLIADVQEAWQTICAFKLEPTALPEEG